VDEWFSNFRHSASHVPSSSSWCAACQTIARIVAARFRLR